MSNSCQFDKILQGGATTFVPLFGVPGDYKVGGMMVRIKFSDDEGSLVQIPQARKAIDVHVPSQNEALIDSGRERKRGIMELVLILQILQLFKPPPPPPHKKKCDAPFVFFFTCVMICINCNGYPHLLSGYQNFSYKINIICTYVD